MTLFPDYDESADSVTGESAAVPAAEIKASFERDADTGFFRLLDGTPEESTGAAAVKAWIHDMLSVRQGENEAFDGLAVTPGIDREGLRRKALPDGFRQSETMREIRDTLELCPGILTADGFEFSRLGRGLRVRFTVRLRTNETVEVEEDVG